jgi:hypothetical protein
MAIAKSSPEDNDRIVRISGKVIDVLNGEKFGDGLTVLCKLIAHLIYEHNQDEDDQKCFMYEVFDMINRNYKQEKKENKRCQHHINEDKAIENIKAALKAIAEKLKSGQVKD